MGRACSTHGCIEKYTYIELWREGQKKRDQCGDIDLDGRIILRWILKDIGLGGIDWIDLA
jgi:hypothetical protein